MLRIITMTVALAVAATAQASAGTVENSFGHTVVSRGADGVEQQWRYAPDGTFTMTAAGQTIHGAWAYANGRLCITPQGGQTACYADTGDHHLGDTWTMTGADNKTVTITIIN